MFSKKNADKQITPGKRNTIAAKHLPIRSKAHTFLQLSSLFKTLEVSQNSRNLHATIDLFPRQPVVGQIERDDTEDGIQEHSRYGGNARLFYASSLDKRNEIVIVRLFKRKGLHGSFVQRLV